MKKYPYRNSYLAFLVSLVGIVILLQILLWQNNEYQRSDALLLNKSGRQRMLSQRIPNLLRKIQLQQLQNEDIQPSLDTLNAVIGIWMDAHQSLLEHPGNTPTEDSLLHANTSRIESITQAISELNAETTQDKLAQTVIIVDRITDVFLSTMEKVVSSYQEDSENKFDRLNYWSLALSALAILILIVEFIYIILPTTKRLYLRNKQLAEMNDELSTSEEEIRSNLEHINSLKENLEEKEKNNRIFIEQSPSAIAMFDKNMRYVTASNQWKQDFDIEDISIIGKTFEEVIPETPEEWKKIHQSCLQGDIYRSSAMELPRASGDIQWIRQEVRPWYSAEKTISGIIIYSEDITRLKEQEKESEKIRRILDKASEAARIGTWEVDLETSKVSWNKVTQDIHEVGEDFIPDIDTALMFYKKGESRDKIEHAVNVAIATGKPYDVELELITSKGKSVWTRAIGLPEFKNGQCIRLYGIFQDIDDRKKANQVLAEERKLLRTVIDNIPINIYMKDLDSRKILVNKAECEFLRLKEEDILGKDDLELFPYQSAIESIKEDQEIFKTGVAIREVETLKVKKDKSKAWFITSKIPLFDAQGNATSLLGISYNITSRKIAEDQAKNLLNRMRTIMDATTEVSIIASDLKGNITHFNKGAENMLEYRAEEVIQTNTPVIFHEKQELEERARHLYDINKEAFTGFDIVTAEALEGQPVVREWTYIKKYGSKIKVQLVVTTIKNEHNDTTGFLSVATDITEKAKNEKKLIQAKTDLEGLTQSLTERNAQLANFAHIASHNLRSPVSNLNSILNLYYQLENQPDKDALFIKFETVIKHLSETLNVLIDTLKIRENTQVEIEYVKFDEVLSKVSEILTGQITETNATIERDFTDAPGINYNRTYLESIFLNLISNALKYSRTNVPPVIKVRSQKENEKIIITVSDNGLGIDLQRHGAKVFGLNKTFHRGKDSKGVGLFITKTQVEALGGEISVDSTPNEGSVFTIKFTNQ